jgi:hypothetical protein
MVLHKDSQWFQSWQSFKDNNQFVHSKYMLNALLLAACIRLPRLGGLEKVKD